MWPGYTGYRGRVVMRLLLHRNRTKTGKYSSTRHFWAKKTHCAAQNPTLVQIFLLCSYNDRKSHLMSMGKFADFL
jgi:hypothetical protein